MKLKSELCSENFYLAFILINFLMLNKKYNKNYNNNCEDLFVSRVRYKTVYSGIEYTTNIMEQREIRITIKKDFFILISLAIFYQHHLT